MKGVIIIDNAFLLDSGCKMNNKKEQTFGKLD